MIKKNKLVFICGFPGGGTDLTKTILNAHPDVYISGEMPFLKTLVQYGYDHTTKFDDLEALKIFQLLLKRLDEWHNLQHVDYDFHPLLASKGELSLMEVLRNCFSKGEPSVWGNKTPQNTENIGALLELFPDAHFIIVTRDIRDVCLSWRNKWGKNMIWCADKWTKRMGIGWLTTQKLPPDYYLFVKFEDMLLDTEITCRKICDFLDIPFSSRMLEHHKHIDEKLDGKINYGQAVNATNRRKWETLLSPKMVRRIEEIAFDTMTLLGYELTLATQAKGITPLELWYGRGYDILAMFTVGNRASDHNTIGRRLKTLTFEIRKLCSNK